MLYLRWKIQVRIFFQGLVKSWSNDSNSNLMREIERRCYLYADSNSNSWMEMFNRGRGVFLYGEAPLQSSTPYHFLYHFLEEKVPVYLLLTNDTPSTNLVWNFPSPLNCSKGAVFKIWINHKTGTFSRLFHGHEMHLLALLGLYRPKWQISSPFHILRQVKCIPFIYLKPEKGIPVGRSLPVWATTGSTPHGCLTLPPPPGTYKKTIPIR